MDRLSPSPSPSFHLLRSPSGGFPGIRVDDDPDPDGSGGGSHAATTAHTGGQTSPAVDDPSVELDAFLQANESGGSEGSPYCEVDGKQVPKQRVLTEFMGSHYGSASRDRVKRVQGPTATPSGVAALPEVGSGDTEGAGIANTDARGLCVGDPFAMMVAMGRGQYTLGLFCCTVAPSEGTRVGSGAVVKGKLMKLKQTTRALEAVEGASTSGAVSAAHSAPVGDSWDHWGDLGMHKGELSCKVRLVLPLDPDIVVEPAVVEETVTRTAPGEGPATEGSVHVVERTLFHFTRADLVAVKATLVEELGALKAWNHVPLQRIAGADANPLPIHEDLVHVEADRVGVAPAGGGGYGEDLVQAVR